MSRRVIVTQAGADRTVPDEGGDDQGSALIFALVVLLLVTTLALALAATVTQRVKDLVFERSRTLSVHAAETGLDAATVVLRAAGVPGPADTVSGVTAMLPCHDVSPLVGTVGRTGPGLGYSVRIRYFTKDPTNTSAGWRAANALACSSPGGPSTTPEYALLQSKATGSQVLGSYGSLQDRSVEAVYRFRVTNANLPGGLVHTRTHESITGVSDLCWGASGTPATVGTSLVVTTCAEGSPAQSFAYNSDYTLSLTSTGLCLTADGAAADPSAILRRCDGSADQAWTYNTDDQIQALAGDRSRLAPYCLSEAVQNSPGTSLVAHSCSASYDKWSPDPTVGSGGAGPGQQQLVSFGQFGRCFDVTDLDLNHSFMQAHPCKQNAAGPLDWWPQQVAPDPVTGQIYIGRYVGQSVEPGSLPPYCLTSPLTRGAWITTTPCAGTAGQRWVVNTDTGTYATSYTVVDSSGLCLAIGPLPEPGWTFNALVSQTCDGGTMQKWNAPAELVDSGLGSFSETTGR